MPLLKRTIREPAMDSDVRTDTVVLATAAGIGHRNLIGAPVTRSLIAYAH
ncbi:hypothetical protein GCM10022403_045430 [Streptomyces coacervatus]|uniref:Uncharacterized protein n=1 Tax=Streptomyces coacervatus TaxID=647381 RepID=A0ABP7HYN6_9ACTN